MVGMKKGVASKKLCCVVLCSKVVGAVGFSGKSISFGNCLFFFNKMLCVTNFEIVLGVCTVNVVVFSKKNDVNILRITFCELFKILIMVILKMFEKLNLFFLKKTNKN